MRRPSLSGVEECYRGKHVRVFRLDRAAIVGRLRRAADRLIVDRADVLDVRLFGSLARGDAVPGSDADILIVVRDGAGPFLERTRELAPYFEGVGVGCDVLVYTESEYAERVATPSIVKTAAEQGVPLATRNS